MPGIEQAGPQLPIWHTVYSCVQLGLKRAYCASSSARTARAAGQIRRRLESRRRVVQRAIHEVGYALLHGVYTRANAFHCVVPASTSLSVNDAARFPVPCMTDTHACLGSGSTLYRSSSPSDSGRPRPVRCVASGRSSADCTCRRQAWGTCSLSRAHGSESQRTHPGRQLVRRSDIGRVTRSCRPSRRRRPHSCRGNASTVIFLAGVVACARGGRRVQRKRGGRRGDFVGHGRTAKHGEAVRCAVVRAMRLSCGVTLRGVERSEEWMAASKPALRCLRPFGLQLACLVHTTRRLKDIGNVIASKQFRVDQ